MASLTGTETASSSGAPRRWIYDVFLSFRGADTRNNFVDHLYDALIRRSVHTFKDDEQLETGMSIPLELLRAIQESMFAIVVFSRNYATSSWCLDELVKIMECRNLTGLTVIPVFYQVEPSVIRYQTGSFADAFAKHEVRCKEKVPGWRKALIEVTSISGLDVSNTANGRESKCIEILVDKIVQEKSHMVSSVVEQFVGADSLVENIQPLSLRKVKQFTSNIKDINIIQNPEFLEDGKQWARNLCRAEFSKSLGCARTTNRVKYYSGIEQDISARVQKGLVYELNAEVRVSGDGEDDVDATIHIRRHNLSTSIGLVARALATKKSWVKLEGKFLLPCAPLTAVICLNGSPPGTDIFVRGPRVCARQAPADLDLQVRFD
ncbi:hypothetical protein RJ640_024604 [Escallonia rubra]|uniref:ADP-ribosyl cyclase/cyclic ADP-ribose hydrolase n=1 Tax=Escallonia rubra TaxID=112253 RepID=A0AA88RNQ6_9ASTE|nr:hypothetical protein RJ640_024604 [Escallonia rubra]